MKFIIYVFALSLILPSIKPENNSTINYIHVLFEWDIGTSTGEYKLTVLNNNTTILETTTPNSFYVDKSNIEWNNTYTWEVCEVNDDADVHTACDGPYTFSTASEMDLGELNITVEDPNQYSEGVTIFGNLTPAFSAAIDENGRQIWHTGGLNTLCYFNYDESNGSFYGGKYEDDPINMLPGIEFDINANIIFEEPHDLADPNYAFVQHEIIKINDTQYLFLIPEDQQHPIPSCATTPGCTDSDGEYSWEDDFFEGQPVIWRGEKIILWDTETNQVEWEWNAFDHISLHDYDFIVNWGAVTQLGYYDWTHFNALSYVAEENAVYVSSRHLSRIYKLALNSYDDLETTDNDETIIWSMGFDPTGNGKYNSADAEEENIKFIQLNDSNGNYNGFSFQHGLQILENGNIVTLDNGNISSLLIDEYDGDNFTRALEISVNEDENTANIEWEKRLDQNLFGALSGNAQKLNNGNYLITTIGNYGHSIEVNNNGDIVSDLQYKIDNYVTGKMYRAHRIKSIYPIGCTDINACNYNSDARVNDDSCEYPIGTCDCGSVDTDGDGVCDDSDLCPDIYDPYQNDYDNDGDADACNDIDDDNDGLIDCWNFWYDDGVLLSDDEKNELIESGECEDFALNINQNIIPGKIELINAYPNPFNPKINFDINMDNPNKIKIDIYSINGHLINSIYDGFLPSGKHSYTWDASSYTSGLYIINLTWDNNSINKKVVLLK